MKASDFLSAVNLIMRTSHCEVLGEMRSPIAKARSKHPPLFLGLDLFA